MALYQIISPIKVGGQHHRPGGDPVELTATEAGHATGCVQLVNADGSSDPPATPLRKPDLGAPTAAPIRRAPKAAKPVAKKKATK